MVKTKLKTWIKNRQDEIKRGYEITQQQRAEKLRRKNDNIIHAKPGAVTSIRKGLMTRSSPLDVMKEEYSRRKYEREQKKKQED